MKHVQLVGAGLIVCFGLSAIANPGFTLLGKVDRFPSNYLGQDQMPSNFLSQATDVSFDGSVVVGMAQDKYGQNGIFRWTAGAGMTPLPIPADVQSSYYATAYVSPPKVSDNGSKIAGTLYLAQGDFVPFVWTQSGGYKRMLPPFAPPGLVYRESEAADISGDGNFVVGTAYFSFDSYPYYYVRYPLRWDDRASRGATLEPANGEFTPAFDISSGLTATSRDGSISIGYGLAEPPSGTYCSPRTFSAIWDQSSGNIPDAITDTSPCGPSDYANVMTADGTIALGQLGQNASLGRWTQQTGFILLDDPTASIVPVGISDDGMVAAVQYTGNYGDQQIPLIWTPRHGLRFLEDVLEEQGAKLHNWFLVDVQSLSGDGTSFVGMAQSLLNIQEAYKATIKPYCPADVNDDDQVDLSDFFDFFNCFDTGGPCADINGDGANTLEDFFAFFNHFDTGC